MRILLLGATGQVGIEAKRSLATLGNLLVPSRKELDLGSPSFPETLATYRPDIIVNAYTAVDKAETDQKAAYQLNEIAPQRLAAFASKTDAWLIHFSTDYVFDGKKIGGYREEDAPNPLNIYGQSKLKGEQAIMQSACNHLIFRTSWVYSHHRQNFAKTILRLAEERHELKIVDDQIGAPTSAALIADVTAACLKRLLLDPEFAEKAYGTYNLTPSGKTSWYGFAKFLIEKARVKGMKLKTSAQNVRPVATKDHPATAARPANSCLITDKLTKTFALEMPAWQTHADHYFSCNNQRAPV